MCIRDRYYDEFTKLNELAYLRCLAVEAAGIKRECGENPQQFLRYCKKDENSLRILLETITYPLNVLFGKVRAGRVISSQETCADMGRTFRWEKEFRPYPAQELFLLLFLGLSQNRPPRRWSVFLLPKSVYDARRRMQRFV